ncbi:MAG: type II toxin-antitoxin system RelE/ParE family toxin [Lachnospiraceae bacterium]|nr:type II toxin-antitoxin system RelE/ParE family toxin [Lachnospiraceae bacterium]
MTKTFIQTNEFAKNWSQLGLTDEDLRTLENELLSNPKAGKVIRGTGNLRKYRFSLPNRGKSGSARVCYVDFVIQETIYFITVYSKNEKDNLSKSERNNIKKLIITLEKSLS